MCAATLDGAALPTAHWPIYTGRYLLPAQASTGVRCYVHYVQYGVVWWYTPTYVVVWWHGGICAVMSTMCGMHTYDGVCATICGVCMYVLCVLLCMY